MKFILPKVSDEEHEVNILMLTLSDDGINRVLRRIRNNKNIGECGVSILNQYKEWELRRLIIDFSVNLSTNNLNQLFYAVYGIHSRWWEMEHGITEVPF